ncbi:hypothetical protein [Halovivax sp.]|uniref:hypothetical protein n=1 Tax=Halovivax sp. TaxID=1935978 RepID=UPI0025BE7443|nr:hypothetical protein [Halovivax sp.]
MDRGGDDDGDRPRAFLAGLLVLAALATLVLHLGYVPRHFPEEYYRAVPYLAAGWVSYAMVFYVLGRLASDPSELPSMRSGDVGAALALLALLLAVALDAGGFSPRLVLEAYVVLAVPLYAGLALVGWSLGRRTRAINRIAGRR